MAESLDVLGMDNKFNPSNPGYIKQEKIAIDNGRNNSNN